MSEIKMKTKEELERQEAKKELRLDSDTLEEVSGGGARETCPSYSHQIVRISPNESYCRICGLHFYY